MAGREWTKKELVLWGLGMCGGATKFVDTETVGVLMFERVPGLFGLKNYPKYPDIDAARVQLSTWKQDRGENEPIRVIQDTDERKRESGADRVLSRNASWKLNEEGIQWYAANHHTVQTYVDSLNALGARRNLGTSAGAAKKISAAVLERIHKAAAFKKFAKEPTRKWTEKDLPILDFFNVFNLDAHTPEHLYQSARERALASVEDNSPEEAFLQELSKLYGHQYRTYYDKLLAEGE